MKPEKRVIHYDHDERGPVRAEFWHVNGKYHREDGPAIINYYRNGAIKGQGWFLNGRQHREDGPAVIVYHEDESVMRTYFYINDRELSPEETQDFELRLEIDRLAEQMLVGEL